MSTEPRSIVHGIIRLEMAIENAISRKSRSNQRRPSVVKSSDQQITTSSSFLVPFTNMVPSTNRLHDEPSVTRTYASFSEFESSEYCCRVSPTPVLPSMQTRSSGGYRTITQDELIDSRLGRKTGKIILHFFSEDSEQAEYLDQQMTQLASLFRGCTFLRVEGRYAPLIARKLNVKQFPSIVAVRNGEAVDCIRDFKSREDGFVQEWFFKTGFVGFL